MADTYKTYKTIEAQVQDYNLQNYQNIGSASDGNRASRRFVDQVPAKYLTVDPVDDEISIRANLAAINKNIANNDTFGAVALDESVIKKIQIKQQQLEAMRFEDWIMRLFATGDAGLEAANPYLYSTMNRAFPEIRQKREVFLDRQIELQRKLALMKLKSVEELTKEDYIILYLIMCRKLVVHDGPIHNYVPNAGTNTKDMQFARGVFNPLRWVNETARYNVPGVVTDIVNRVIGAGSIDINSMASDTALQANTKAVLQNMLAKIHNDRIV
jgi:hypothetical protein